MTWMEWYNSLPKPTWTPAPSTISLIWMILYPIILISFGFVFIRAFQGKVSRLVAVPFAINLVANLLFMPIFAGLRNVPLACVDILIVWATIIWCVVVRSPTSALHSAEGRKADVLVQHFDLREPDLTQQVQLEQ